MRHQVAERWPKRVLDYRGEELAAQGYDVLRGPPGGVVPTLSDELVMGSRFNNLSLFHHVNLICKSRRSEAVSDDDRGAPLRKTVKSVQPFGFGPRIHGAGGLIKQDHWRFP